MSVTEGHLSELTPDEKNVRAHTPRNVGLLVDALHEVGAARSIVVDEEGRILAGNATVEAAAEAGITKVLKVPVDGETLVAVVRSGLTETQKERLAIFDNRAGELSSWDTQLLAELQAETPGLLEGLFTDTELRLLFKDLPAPVNGAELWQGMPEFEQDDAFGAVQSIKVHFETREDVAEFARLIDQTLTPKTKAIWFPYKERMNLKELAYERAEDE